MSVGPRLLELSERSPDEGCREIRLRGDLDLSSAARFQERLDAAVRDDVDVLVCLDGCEFIDSTGIAVIVLGYKRLGDRGRRLLVCHPSPEVSRILSLTGLTDEGLVVDGSDPVLSERFGHDPGRKVGQF